MYYVPSSYMLLKYLFNNYMYVVCVQIYFTLTCLVIYIFILFISFQPSKGGKYDMQHSGTKVHINETVSTALKLIALGPCVHK